MPIPTNIMKALSQAENDAEESEEDRLERQVRVLREALVEVQQTLTEAAGHDSYCEYRMDLEDWKRDGAPKHERAACNCWKNDIKTCIDAALAATEKENDDG